MSYTGTQVYFPASTSFDVIRDVLAARFPTTALAAAGEHLILAFDQTKVVRIARDAGAHVAEEAKWLGKKATAAAARAALDTAAFRVEIVPDDPSADFDDMYNELLFVFEVLHAMPGAVGADPFDGTLHHSPATATATAKPAARAKTAAVKAKKKPVAKAKAKAKKRPVAKTTRKPTAKKKKKKKARSK